MRNVYKSIITGSLLMVSLFLLMAWKVFDIKISGGFSAAWYCVILRMTYTAWMYPFILTFINPPLIAVKKVNIIHVYAFFEFLNMIDWILTGMTSPFRTTLCVLLMVITFVYFYFNAFEN